MFGGGPNAFSRYENRKTKQALVLVKLLMVLDRHPNLLNEVQAGRPAPPPLRSHLRRQGTQVIWGQTL